MTSSLLDRLEPLSFIAAENPALRVDFRAKHRNVPDPTGVAICRLTLTDGTHRALTSGMSRPTILCPIDFSIASRGALRYAIAIAEHFGARLTLLTVSDPLLNEAAELQHWCVVADRRRPTATCIDSSNR